ncbi:DsrE family protein [Kordiimonas sp. SCSIO 12610]|uniref:DsrE family protein n=1 Tax=Kordiimonas sp. SCSIO 12610 TaxID=2829597 RepID=UPI00210A40AC|nr:DsrE family protein [Kordiimonas sp. SCSIO 12610]UTW53990.1 DsrE family protein [Kordiimonas sp. SCSIO 12610]
MRSHVLFMLGLVLINSDITFAQSDKFKTGPLITDYGPVARVKGAMAIPDGTKFKVSFDLTKQADAGTINRKLESVARFLNMHVANGVPAKDIELALVVHGSAVFDFVNDEKYGDKNGQSNSNKSLISELQKHNVKIYICGQSATYQGVNVDDLLPDVKMSLSAMTAHALLQQMGFTINPF